MTQALAAREAEDASLLTSTLGRMMKICANHPDLKRLFKDFSKPPMSNIYWIETTTIIILLLVCLSFARKSWGGFCAATSPFDSQMRFLTFQQQFRTLFLSIRAKVSIKQVRVLRQDHRPEPSQIRSAAFRAHFTAKHTLDPEKTRW